MVETHETEVAAFGPVILTGIDQLVPLNSTTSPDASTAIQNVVETQETEVAEPSIDTGLLHVDKLAATALLGVCVNKKNADNKEIPMHRLTVSLSKSLSRLPNLFLYPDKLFVTL